MASSPPPTKNIASHATPTSTSHPRRYRRQDDNASTSSSSEGEAIDPNEFDLMLSRSIQSGGGVLEPESFEHSMLRNTRKHSCSRRRHRSISAFSPRGTRRPFSSSPHPEPRDSDKKSDVPPDEETPLLTDSPSSPVLEDVDGTAKTPYLGGVSPPRFWVLFVSLMIAYFIACFDSTIMASSHPVITSYFGSSNSASWLSTAFLLTSTACQPLLGGLSDAVGRKAPFVVTMFLFLVATLWCALAGSMTSFIIARAVCGVGAGGMMTISSIIISDLVPIEIRGAYQSYINIAYGAGAMLGAGLGGMMADYLGWRWEFGVQVPVIMLVFVASIFTIPDGLGLHGKRRQSVWEGMKTFDFKGSFLMITAVTFLILGLSLGGNVLPWSHPFVLSSIAIFAIFFPLFLHVETHAVKPIMPMYLILTSPHRNLIFSNSIAALLSNAMMFNIPLYFQGVLLTSATTSGLRLVTTSAVTATAGTCTGFLITYTRRLKWPLILGTTLIFLGFVSLSCMQRGWPTALYLLCLAIPSTGQGFQFPGTFMAILTVVDQRAQAVVTSTLILWRSLGFVLGIAGSSLIVQNALWRYLEMYVSGPEKEEVIARVRQSVEAIRELEPVYQEQVIQSYEAAIRLTFMCCSVVAALSVLLAVPMKLPRLAARK